MSTAKLAIAPPPKEGSIEALIEWTHRSAKLGTDLCSDALAYFDAMKAHNESLTELMAEINLYKDKTDDESLEECQNIVKVICEVYEAMDDLRHSRLTLTDNAEKIEDTEKKLLSRDSFQDAKNAIQSDRRKFLAKYNEVKSSLGLKTQQDVAEKTGLDRRQISRIENSKHKPQFKTLQKLAIGLGVRIEKFL